MHTQPEFSAASGRSCSCPSFIVQIASSVSVRCYHEQRIEVCLVSKENTPLFQQSITKTCIQNSLIKGYLEVGVRSLKTKLFLLLQVHTADVPGDLRRHMDKLARLANI